MKEFNSYGNLIDKVLDDIKPNDKVEFWYHHSITIGKRNLNQKVIIQGIWDGEKVCFKDDKETIVRTKEWLKLI